MAMFIEKFVEPLEMTKYEIISSYFCIFLFIVIKWGRLEEQFAPML